MLAMLIDGYKLAQHLRGERDGARAAREITEHIENTYFQRGEWLGSAAEMWVALFFMHRRDHFQLHVEAPIPDPNDYRDELVTALCAQLIQGDHWPS